MNAVLRNNGALLEHTFYADGAPVDATGNVTVTITGADGTVISNGIAAHVGAAGSGTYSYNLPPQATLNMLSVSWAGTFSGIAQTQVDDVEIVGGFFCSIDELQNFGDAKLNDPTKYPTDVIATTRREFEDLAETYCGVAFVPRFALVKVIGNARTSILLPNRQVRTLLSAKSTSSTGTVTPYTLTNWRTTVDGLLYTSGQQLDQSLWGEPNITVAYEHGYDMPPPQIARACKMWVRSQLLADRTSFGRDVLQETDASGMNIRYSTPDWEAGRPTGIFDVDRALNSVGRQPVSA